ncbi:NhaP-type Na+/H+ and K+/H+ antiporter [Candidatus Burkholderia verschuerenii]|uniref:NhaP-type Na+/H+ and K+/H+ antiporter n=1 Tax=Candidatus Burkholderia verschuerenii TaxID=242163 RepID=A0A0L0M9V0_9BURK|nr:Na+/H+ antiporter [Candidatus Burkholderia verschuerenii]KND59143.1 NhaP-type Na+/H+ and K+/H+ antiporter [Candidatus Burkholderia verschuerenii]
MEIVFTVLILLTTVALSGLGLSLLPVKLPLPLVQIVIGACLAWPGFGLHVTFDPELFMLLFIPPLLFADGWRIPKRELYMQRRAVLMLALGLVFITVGALGYFLHAMIPSMPLPVAFALAAVLSPTDAVALSGIAGRNRIPANLMHILEGEALMNDASGLVALKFAIAAALTGMFSMREATISFFIIAAGGLAIGAAISWAVTEIPQRLLRFSEDDDPAAGVVLTILIPFAAYVVAERVGCSGILAAVSGGMMMNIQSLRDGIPSVARVRMANTWTMIEFVFNGMVFILLGLQLPHIIGQALVEAHHDGSRKVGLLIGYVLAMVFALYALRFVWVYCLRWFASRAAVKHGIESAAPGFRTLAMTTIGGVRGAVTLAGVLSLPVTLDNGTPLEGRDLAIFIASAVILASLLIAVIGLPILLRGTERLRNPHAAEERMARRRAAQAAIRAIDDTHDELVVQMDEAASARCADSTARVMGMYRRRLESLGDDEAPRVVAKKSEMVETRLKMAALSAERAELFRLRAAQAINDETLFKLLREIDLSETAIVNRKRGLAA